MGAGSTGRIAPSSKSGFPKSSTSSEIKLIPAFVSSAPPKCHRRVQPARRCGSFHSQLRLLADGTSDPVTAAHLRELLKGSSSRGDGPAITARQVDVLTHVALGLRNNEIANGWTVGHDREELPA